MKTGVYTITNLIDGKIYVGSACESFLKRKNNHWHHLRKNYHRNKHLQGAWNKYGEENFKFEILEESEPYLCIYLEHYWCNLLNVLNPKYGYNIMEPLTNNLGKTVSKETRDKISKSLKGRVVPEQVRQNMSKGAISMNRVMSQKQKDLLYKANKGKVVSQETKNLLSKALSKPRINRRIKINQYDKNMNLLKLWDSIGEASESLGIKRSSLSNNLKLNSKTTGGFIFRYAS